MYGREKRPTLKGKRGQVCIGKELLFQKVLAPELPHIFERQVMEKVWGGVRWNKYMRNHYGSNSKRYVGGGGLRLSMGFE